MPSKYGFGNKRKAKKALEKQKKSLSAKQKTMRYGDKEGAWNKGSIERMGAVAHNNKKRYGKRKTGELDKKAISKLKKTPKVRK